MTGFNAATDTRSTRSPRYLGQPLLQGQEGRQRDRPLEVHQDIEVARRRRISPCPRSEQRERADRPLGLQPRQRSLQREQQVRRTRHGRSLAARPGRVLARLLSFRPHGAINPHAPPLPSPALALRPQGPRRPGRKAPAVRDAGREGLGAPRGVSRAQPGQQGPHPHRGERPRHPGLQRHLRIPRGGLSRHAADGPHPGRARRGPAPRRLVRRQVRRGGDGQPAGGEVHEAAVRPRQPGRRGFAGGLHEPASPHGLHRLARREPEVARRRRPSRSPTSPPPPTSPRWISSATSTGPSRRPRGSGMPA